MQSQASALAVSVVADDQGNVWRASVNNGYIWVDQSADLGKSFSAPVRVNIQPQKIAAEGEARPKIAWTKAGHVYLTWTESLKKPYAGYIWFARSINGGKTFDSPYIVHQDRAEITHRFDALNVSPDGKITVVWVDKRDLLAAKTAGKKYDGAAIYYAVSDDQGKSFKPEKKLADSSCECCRIALTNKPDGTVVAMWRHVFEGSERDHAIAEIGLQQQPATIVRASYGHWKIDGCPHHGGSLAYGAGFGYHMAYFDGAGDQPSLMIARMDSEAWVSSPPKRFGHMKHHAAHPALYSQDELVWLVWQETNDAKVNNILSMRSVDGGKTWTKPQVVLSSHGKVDYPQLLEIKNSVYLAINTQVDGFLMVPFSK